MAKGLGSKYLELMESNRIEPNFWCSEEYFKHANCEELRWDYKTGISAPDYGLLLPPISNLGRVSIDPGINIWADFPGYMEPFIVEFDYLRVDRKFLDYNYIYDPRNFLDMSGGDWSVFRKNVRKWPRSVPVGVLVDYRRLLSSGDWYDEQEELFLKWLSNRPEDNIQDDEVMMNFYFNGEHRAGLFRGNELVGVNVWDYNWKYVNYRYCICLPEPFLSEYMRFLFYTNPVSNIGGKMVNDGGVLDKPSLKAFKDKLNPVEVKKIYSWEFKGGIG